MISPSPELYLIRHGETEWSRAGRHTGRTDLPLTARGEREAAALRTLLAERRFALVLTSPLQRARETCRLAGLGSQAQLVPDLMEWDYGAYEGCTAEEIRSRAPGWLLWTNDVPDGETAAQVGVRARRVIDLASQAPGDVALFAHGHVLRILAACWVGLPPQEGRRLALGTASIGILATEGGGRIIRRWNLPAEAVAPS